MLRRVLLALLILATKSGAEEVISGDISVIRVLDKVTAEIVDVEIPSGSIGVSGLLTISVRDCRMPKDNPSGNAYAYISVNYADEPKPVFSGWMIANAPALNAMEHPRYDVWPLRCSTQ